MVTIYISSFRHSQEPLDMTTTAGNNGGGGAGSRALPPKERASVIMASPVVITAAGHRASSTTTGGMSDPVIDEHFRRSLGKDYMNVFAPTVAQRDQHEQVQQSQQQQQQQTTTADEPDEDSSGLSGTTCKLLRKLISSRKRINRGSPRGWLRVPLLKNTKFFLL